MLCYDQKLVLELAFSKWKFTSVSLVISILNEKIWRSHKKILTVSISD